MACCGTLARRDPRFIALRPSSRRDRGQRAPGRCLGQELHRRRPRRLSRCPKTRSMLREVFNDLEDGAGFRGRRLPVDRFTYEENLIGYAGVSAHLGTLVDQSYAGAMKADVKDLGLAYGKDVRGYQSSAMLRFHTDGAVLTGLLCLQNAVEGGLSVLASSGVLSNRIIEERPNSTRSSSRASTITGAEITLRATIPCRLRPYRSSRSTTDYSLHLRPQPVVVVRRRRHCVFAEADRGDGLPRRPNGASGVSAPHGDAERRHPVFEQFHRHARAYRISRQRHAKAPSGAVLIDVPNGKRKGLTTRDLYVRDGGLDVQQS